MVTIVEGIDDTAIDINQLAKILKGACASGGTVKGRTIELQGEHKKRAARTGFSVFPFQGETKLEELFNLCYVVGRRFDAAEMALVVDE